MPRTVQPSFLALDADTYRDGECWHGFAAKSAARNANYLVAKTACRRLVNTGYAIHTHGTVNSYGVGYRLSAIHPKPIAPPYRLRIGPHAREAEIRWWAKIENLLTVRVFASATGERMSDPNMVGSLAFLGDGTFKKYPTAGTWTVKVEPNSEAQINIWMASTPAPIAITEKTAVSNGTLVPIVTALGGTAATVPPAPAPDFSQIDGVDADANGEYTTHDFYMRVRDANGNDISGGWRRIKSGDSSSRFAWDGPMFTPAIGPPPLWDLARGPTVQIGNIAVYEKPLNNGEMDT